MRTPFDYFVPNGMQDVSVTHINGLAPPPLPWLLRVFKSQVVEKLVIEGNGLESSSGKLGFFSRMPAIFSENLSSPMHNHGPQHLFISSTWINV